MLIVSLPGQRNTVYPPIQTTSGALRCPYEAGRGVGNFAQGCLQVRRRTLGIEPRTFLAELNHRCYHCPTPSTCPQYQWCAWYTTGIGHFLACSPYSVPVCFATRRVAVVVVVSCISLFSKPAWKQTTQLYIVSHAQQDKCNAYVGDRNKAAV